MTEPLVTGTTGYVAKAVCAMPTTIIPILLRRPNQLVDAHAATRPIS